MLTSTYRHWLEFLLAMTEKEIKARYKHAVLGFLWVILNPLLQMAVIGLVFQFFVPVAVDNYFLFLFAGLLPWNFFSQSILKSTPSIVYERSLIQKSAFPREVIVLSIIFSTLFHSFISFLLLITVLIMDKALMEAYNFSQLTAYFLNMVWLIPALLWLVILTVGVSLVLAALNVRYRDVHFAVQALTPLWFYATPILYTLDLLPSELWVVSYLNPMTAIIELFHFTLLKHPPALIHYWPLSIVSTVLLFILSIIFFRHSSRTFDDWV